VGKTIREKTSLLPGSCAPSGHLRAVGVSPFTCPPPATGKGSLTNEYNGRDIEAWRRQLATKRPGAPLVPGNDMALWARDNTWYVELGVGSPDPAAFPSP
jgi:hypothetical protein